MAAHAGLSSRMTCSGAQGPVISQQVAGDSYGRCIAEEAYLGLVFL